MINKTVAATATFESWRKIARESIAAGLSPADIIWSRGSVPQVDLFSAPPEIEIARKFETNKVPRLFLELAQACVVIVTRSVSRYCINC